MDDIAGLENLFPHAKDVPAKGEVYKQVHLRLKRLAEVRILISNTGKNAYDPLTYDPLYVNYISYHFQTVHPHPQFRLDILPSAHQIKREWEQARTWLLDIIALQAHHLPRENMIRILRFAIEKPENEWNDIDRLYMALTDAEQGDAEERLEYAFAHVVHYQYASAHAQILARLRENEARRIRLVKKRAASGPSQEAIRARILDKVQSVKVDSFACAIPISSIINVPSQEEHSCPVCRNDYLDFTCFPIEDLIADYPVKIKYCGHVIGKSCLEAWMDTPLADPAKYPHRTCPLCRTRIDFKGCGALGRPQVIQEHVRENSNAMALADRLELEDEECWDGILRLMSEDIVIQELLREVEGKTIVNSEEEERLGKAKTVLRVKWKELGEEKTAWGFGKETKLIKMKKDWMNKTFMGVREDG